MLGSYMFCGLCYFFNGVSSVYIFYHGRTAEAYPGRKTGDTFSCMLMLCISALKTYYQDSSALVWQKKVQTALTSSPGSPPPLPSDRATSRLPASHPPPQQNPRLLRWHAPDHEVLICNCLMRYKSFQNRVPHKGNEEVDCPRCTHEFITWPQSLMNVGILAESENKLIVVLFISNPFPLVCLSRKKPLSPLMLKETSFTNLFAIKGLQLSYTWCVRRVLGELMSWEWAI